MEIECNETTPVSIKKDLNAQQSIEANTESNSDVRIKSEIKSEYVPDDVSTIAVTESDYPDSNPDIPRRKKVKSLRKSKTHQISDILSTPQPPPLKPENFGDPDLFKAPLPPST